MRYFAFIMKLEIMLIGILLMFFNPSLSSAPFMSGVAIFSIGLYLAIQGMYGAGFSGCIFKKPEPIVTKKKGLFSK